MEINIEDDLSLDDKNGLKQTKQYGNDIEWYEFCGVDEFKID